MRPGLHGRRLPGVRVGRDVRRRRKPPAPLRGTPIEGSDLPPLNGLTRPKLHEILTERTQEVGAEIRYKSTFSELQPDADGVTVVYPDGTTERFDYVVGADGVYSQVRSYVLDQTLAPRYIGQSAYRLNMPRLPEIDRIILQKGPKGMAGFVPIGPELAYFFYNTDMPKQERSQVECREQLREHLAPFGGLTGRVRDEFLTEDTEIVLRPEESLISPAPWHRGRIVLMGDAVHAITPHLGQGAAQAIEDGVVLGEVLAKYDDAEQAFAEFTERRYERCKLIVETSLAIGEWEMGRLPDFDNIAATNHVLEVMAQPL
ncbi:2-polyprenyl-6-methoxyphenol hydroxylase [Georgenia yuyongxinii]|uniref:2-polyprenyl-6-methoxyphenol hydroxylase n=1 Tax=Georgenia yuyongxinii TaxID=2589797 RepID=A0A5B8C6W1_9MICO|nr:2-polyprenyl-6-methoxyphenol hydroxylase [Georgenia yuyongxinii]